MITISLCMIVKNEEDSISVCLDSVMDIVDEIIIVDTGSTDQTKMIVEKYTDKIFDFPWVDDFALARNYSFSLAAMDYILWLDADDVILPDSQKKFLTLKETLDRTVDSVTMHYHLSFNKFGKVISSLRRNRLVKRSNNFQWIGAVHEYLQVWGNIINSEVAITHKSIHHDSERNLRIYENKLASGVEFTPRDLYYFANELHDHQQYERAIEFYQKFLATGKGWVEDNLGACGKLADCFNHLGEHENELQYILKSLDYDTPRAEFCCRLGFKFLSEQKYQQAEFWYKLATRLKKPSESWGLMNHACWTWLPHLQLCVCYDRLGKYELAYQHNEIAKSFIPEDSRVLHNKDYLEKLLSSTKNKKPLL